MRESKEIVADREEVAEISHVRATSAALSLIEEIKSRHGSSLIFHQSGGCCDGSSPMCYLAGEFRIGERDIKLGEVGGVPFYIGGRQYEYWKHTDLLLDAISGIGGMFSLDNGTGRRFLIRSNVCTVDNKSN